MSDGATPALGPYSVPPSAEDERIVAPIRNNRPEDIPGLIWRKPDFAASGHKIVRAFAIEGKKRPDRRYIRCAICSGDHPKFLEGAVLWSPDQWLRVIGHVCAARPEHFGVAAYRVMQRKVEQEHLDRLAFHWLEANIAVLPAIAATITDLKAATLFFEEKQKTFFRGVRDLAERLETVAQRYGGVLTVEQELAGSRLVAAELGGAAAQSRFEPVALGTMQGQSFLRRPRSKRSQRLDDALLALARIPEGEGETPLLTLIDRGGEQEITITAIAALRALQHAVAVADDYLDACRFFGPENLSTLKTWGQDVRSPLRFDIRRYADTRVTFVLGDRSQVTLSLAWPPTPDLSLLRRIVDAGVELEGVLKHQIAGTEISTMPAGTFSDAA